MKVEVVTAGSIPPEAREAWAAWQQADRRLANPFLSGSFALLASKYTKAARVAVISESGRPVAFWPISAGRRGVNPVVPGYTDLQGLVHEPDWAWDWHQLLAQMPVGGARFDHLVDYQAEGYAGFRMGESPRVDLTGGWDDYLANLRANHKKTLKEGLRRHRKAQEEFDVEFVDSDSSDESLRILMDQKSAQCRENGWADVFGSDPIRQLIGSVARSTEPDLTGRLSTLRFDGEIAAVRLIVEAFGHRCGWISSYAAAFSAYRPGWNLTLLSLEAAARARCTSFSFGKGNEPYKAEFATASDLVGAGAVAARGLPGRVFLASSLPSEALAAILARSPKTEDALRRRMQELRKWRYRTAKG